MQGVNAKRHLSLQKSLDRVDLPRAVCCQLSMVNVLATSSIFSVATAVKLGDQWPYNSLEKKINDREFCL